MILCIEASNIKAGGGLTHLCELVSAYVPGPGEKLLVFASEKTLGYLPEKVSVIKKSHSWLNRGSFFNMLWRILILPGAIRENKIKLIFSPGGNWIWGAPFVSMSQNMLVFESRERNRFPKLSDRLRYRILEFKQLLSFRSSAAVIFISAYAQNFILHKYPSLGRKKNTIVYHGVSDQFSGKSIPSQGNEIPVFLYVSILNYYKHQDTLIRAAMELEKEGMKFQLQLAGPAHGGYLRYLQPLLQQAGALVQWPGAVPHNQIHELYAKADAFIFSSTCENMPNILVEAMKSGLPIICSSYGPMPEILGEHGIYFDPVSLEDCKKALKEFINRRGHYRQIAWKSTERAALFTWEKCAEQTFGFLRKIASEKN
jgi:glycosyltransferase involved in cell wall biosynthesis